jgi:hypothetical protein
MLEKDEFENWIKASHTLFEIFEGRYDAYPLARKWVQEWLSFKEFAIGKEDLTIINGFIEDFDYDVFRNFRNESERDDDYWERLRNRIIDQFGKFVKNNFETGRRGNVGLAIALFLFTWNFQRFKEYFKKGNIDLEFYFKQLGIFLESKKSELEVFKDKRLISDQIDTNEVKRIFEEINTKLKESGIGHNEPVGTAKLLHIFAPYYFPLIDNSEAQAIGLIDYGESMSSNHYLTWMITLKEWLQNYRELIEKLEREHHSSIIKLTDEGLYIMSTVKQKTRVAELGLWVG